MKLLGQIVRLQIQRFSLKQGAGPSRIYDPAGLFSVDQLTLTAGGAFAPTENGSYVIDVHHIAHPQSRQSNGTNSLSVGFAAHQEAMRGRFGDHLAFGLAGESIIIAGTELVTLASIAAGLLIETRRGHVTLGQIVVARPCAPFARFALGATGQTPEAIKAALQFLDQGMRGFYCGKTDAAPATVEIGNKVFAMSST